MDSQVECHVGVDGPTPTLAEVMAETRHLA